jgi:glycosyltransferase involved in cell wall biosynthesis
METVRAIQERFALAGQTVFLYSGQLIERKGVDVLIGAFERLACTNRHIALMILGDGALRKSLTASVPREIAAHVHFVGHVEQAQLPAYFGAADVFVFPSRHDGWGVVINEACAAGLPIVATRQTGATRDLVVDGVNGFVVQRDDPDGLAVKMRYLKDHPSERIRMGLESRRLVESFSLCSGSSIFNDEVQKTLQLAAGLRRPFYRSGTRVSS